MTEKNIITKIQVLSLQELSPEDRELVTLAREATKNSYTPYSHFNVGAAILLDNGIKIQGSNQENAAFQAGICAERSACFNAGANYPGARIMKLAITAFQHGDFVPNPVPPCGICRQALLEFETKGKHDIEVLLAGRDQVYRLESVKALMPLSFTEF